MGGILTVQLDNSYDSADEEGHGRGRKAQVEARGAPVGGPWLSSEGTGTGKQWGDRYG